MADNNNNAQGASIASGIGSAIGGIFSNLWAAKERRRNQEWNEKMYRDQVMDNRINATTAWNRETDIAYMMNQYKNAGINPYAVTGQSFNAPTAQGGSANPTPQAKGDFSFIGQIPQIMAQMQLLNSQRDNVNADTNLKQTANEQNSFNLSVDKKYKSVLTDTTIENLKQTNSNLQKSAQLIQAQTVTEGNKNQAEILKNIFQSITNRFAETQQQLDIDTKRINNRLSKKSIEHLEAQISNLSAVSQKVYSDINLNKANIGATLMGVYKTLKEAGLTSEKEITERELREDTKRNIQRSNMSIFSPVQKAIQLYRQRDK